MMYDPNNPVIRAFLQTIGLPESGNVANKIYGGQLVSDLSKHPNIPVPITSGPNKGKNSTAAGQYQFLNSTYQDQAKKLGLPDFSAASQDKAAANLAGTTYKTKTGGDLVSDLSDPTKRQGVFKALSGTWTSLPSGIEQTMSSERANTLFDQNLKVFSQDFGPDNPGFASFLPAGSYSGAGGGENSPREMMAPGGGAPAAGGGGDNRMLDMLLARSQSKENDSLANLLANAAKPRQMQPQVQVQEMAPQQDYGQMLMQLLPQTGVPNATMQAAPYNPANMPLSDLLLKI